MMALLVLTVVLLFSCASPMTVPTPASGHTPAPEATGDGLLQDKSGIEVVAVRLSSNEHILDFRYRVKDPEKAASILDKKAKPYLIDIKTGIKLAVPDAPKIGSLRQKTRSPEVDRIYFILFGNQGRLVKRGDAVTVVIGDTKIVGLVVE